MVYRAPQARRLGGRRERQNMSRGVCVFLLIVLHLTSAGGSAHQPSPWSVEPQWTFLQLSATAQAIPIRIVAPHEPWRQVVRDVQTRFPRTFPDAKVRVGFYGHGAFVAPEEVVPHNIRFVAALGLSAALDVMIFPQWQFPQTKLFWQIPRDMLQELWATPPQNLRATLETLWQRPLRQLDRENRAATAQAALRLAHGIQAFHTAQMTPALAAFSNSAIVIVRLGELLAQGRISDGEHTLVLSENVRQAIALRDIVMFGYPLPHGTISPALRQHVQGSIVNVMPDRCWKQLGGNFPVHGPVHNIGVPWAPAHAHWPQLPPQGVEMATLGAFLGGRSEAGRLAVQLALRPDGIRQRVEAWPEAVCDLLPDLQQLLEK